MHYHLTYRYDKRAGAAIRTPDLPSGRTFRTIIAALTVARSLPRFIEGHRLARVCVGMCACPEGTRELETPK